MGWGGVGWGGVGMLTFVCSWTRHACYAEHVVGWRCERSVEVEHASAATLIMWWGGDVNVRLKLNTPLLLRWSWGGVEMWTFGWSWTRLCCYADHGVGWRCERSVEVEHASAATLIMWWGGDVNVRLKLNTPLLLRWSWGGVGWGGVGWRCERSVAVEHATHATLSMWWGGDVNVPLKLNTPLLLRWSWGGVEMWTFGCSWTRHACYAEHVVGWRCERSVEVEHASAATLIMGWGGDVNVRLKLNTPLLLRWSWGGVGWGGDVNVRLQLNTPRMLRWACGGVEMWTFGWSWTRLCCYAEHVVGWRCERSVEVEHASAATLIMGWGGDVNGWWFQCQDRSIHSILAMALGKRFVSWPHEKNRRGLHAQWSMKVARQKRSEICAVRVAKSKKNDLFWEHFFPDQKATKHWKGCHFFQHVDAPTRAIPHPAGCLRLVVDVVDPIKP